MKWGISLCKVLSPNDLGETGSNQSGILIPKNKEILAFFPELNEEIKNPSARLRVTDLNGDKWDFNYKHYNKKLFNVESKKDEYRITGTTEYIRINNLKANDRIIFSKDDEGNMWITHQKLTSD